MRLSPEDLSIDPGKRIKSLTGEEQDSEGVLQYLLSSNGSSYQNGHGPHPTLETHLLLATDRLTQELVQVQKNECIYDDL